MEALLRVGSFALALLASAPQLRALSSAAADVGELRWEGAATLSRRTFTVAGAEQGGRLWGLSGGLSWGLSFPLSLTLRGDAAQSPWVRSAGPPPLAHQWRGGRAALALGLCYTPSDRLSPRLAVELGGERRWIRDAFVWVPYGADGARGAPLPRGAEAGAFTRLAVGFSGLFDDYRGAALELYHELPLSSAPRLSLMGWGLRLSLSSGGYL